MGKKFILTLSILLIYIVLINYISGREGSLKFILSLIFYTFIFYFFHFIKIKITGKPIMHLGDFIKYFLNRISIFLVFITILFGGLSYTSNQMHPAPMPEYTISNGEKTVVFQAMSHIGSDKFYQQIVENITKHKKEGGVYFFEGVKPGTEENNKDFNKAIGITFDKDLYKNFSKLYGVGFQNNQDFLGLINNLDFNIDLNMDQIMESYNQKIETSSGNTQTQIPLDANKQIINTLAELNDKELKILVYINQAILNFIIQNKSTQDFLTNNFANEQLFDVILEERNVVLGNAIINSKYNNIYVTYGLLHFDGTLKLLQENDPKWEIIKTVNYYPIQRN